ncbi:unnamed protein product [Diabrotica balteata]|uniref:Rho GTPase-activating protein 7 n=1 Tax=Diabrotica balteata TaxID=107213 RepID=A0A9P0DTI8_DIABA|nr:unnamed protein product [Diabrotica balteata]
MSCAEHYQDVLKYLEESQNEIAKVFEIPCKNENCDKFEKEKEEEEETVREDNEIRLLIKLNEKIESDVTELLARNEFRQNDKYNDSIINESIVVPCSLPNSFYKARCVVPFGRSRGSSKNHLIAENHRTVHHDVSTQTSPDSLSPSYTSLTWASDYSSSPCFTSASESDSDCFEEINSLSPSPSQLPTFVKNIERKTILGSKFSSTPVLKTKYDKVNKQCRSQSDRHLAEIEAAEACKWLRATGFPQYAQFYQENQFPIDISTVSQDHPLLEADVLHSLFRRLQILNSCAHLHQQKLVNTDDSEEDECCALSDNWTYQSDIKRWSRTSYQPPPQHSSDNVPKQTSVINKEASNRDVVVPSKPTASPKESPAKKASIKNRQRREGIVVCEKNNLLDKITQLQSIKLSDIRHNSDSEATPRTSRRSRTLSLDKTDTWSTSNIKINRILWHEGPDHELDVPEKDVEFEVDGPYIFQLCASQLQVLRKLALLKLTSHMEKYCPAHRTGWNWDLPKFLKKNKYPMYKDKNIFGVPLAIIFQRSGKFLPSEIEEAMLWLQENASDQVGIFRKSGVKSRIQMLRNKIETNSLINYSDQQCYDVADMLKLYFRELPEILLTGKLSETFVLIFQYIPPFLRMESVICALLLLPEEHSQVLQALLNFLLTIASKSELNQMNEYNLAMCWAPTLFHFSSFAKQYQHFAGAPHPKELAENRAAQECLMFFFKHLQNLFKIPHDFINQCNSSEMKEIKPKLLTDIGDDIGGWREYLRECQSNLLKETKEKSRGWIQIPTICQSSKMYIFYKKVADGLPLRLWKISAEIEAPPSEVTFRILRERHIWDPDLISAKIIAQLDNHTEIFQYIRKSVVPIPNEEYCVIRTWRSDLPKDACSIVETSVEYPGTVQIPNTFRGIVLASRYLIEPAGSGKSRVIHFSRVDTMGRSPEWYHKNYGYLCAVFISNLQNSFYQNTNGPESQV